MRALRVRPSTCVTRKYEVVPFRVGLVVGEPFSFCASSTGLLAAKLLGVEPTRAVVIEYAISGVQAGVNGNFGLVIGVARKGNAAELRRHGAHLVVNDLG